MRFGRLRHALREERGRRPATHRPGPAQRDLGVDRLPAQAQVPREGVERGGVLGVSPAELGRSPQEVSENASGARLTREGLCQERQGRAMFGARVTEPIANASTRRLERRDAFRPLVPDAAERLGDRSRWVCIRAAQ